MPETAEPHAYRDEVAEILASFTADVSGDLTPATQHAAKRALGDSIAVSLGALTHPAFKAALRARFMDTALVDRVVAALAASNGSSA